LTEHRLIRLERIASNGGVMWKCKTYITLCGQFSVATADPFQASQDTFDPMVCVTSCTPCTGVSNANCNTFLGVIKTLLDGACLRHGLTPLVSVGQHDATPFVAEFIGQWDPNAGRYPYLKLGEAAELFGIQVLDAHHAAVDAATTWEIVRIMAEDLERV